MFYEPIWTFGDYALVARPDTPYLYITWRKPGARRWDRRSTRTTDVELAKTRLIEFATALDSAAAPTIIPEPHEVLVDEVIEYYFERHMTPTNRSYAVTLSALKPLERFFAAFGVTRVCHLTPDTMDEYAGFRSRDSENVRLAQLLSYGRYAGWAERDIRSRIRPISDATVGRELSVLNAALRFYHKRGRITRVPFVQLPPSVEPRQRWLTRHEFEMLKDAADSDRLRDYLTLAIQTLQRPGFLFDLTVDQVDLPNRCINFLKRGQRQSRKRRPAIRMSETAAETLERLVHTTTSGYILEYDGKPIRTRLRKAFGRAVDRCGLNEGHQDPVIPYTLRHTGATWLAQAGVPLWEIAGILGHKDTRMVERVYAKHHPDFQRRATDVLDRLGT